MTGVLHLMCGKIAAGKSTLAARLAEAPEAILISEDRLLARLYPGEIASPADYVRCAGPGEAEGFRIVVHDQAVSTSG